MLGFSRVRRFSGASSRAIRTITRAGFVMGFRFTSCLRFTVSGEGGVIDTRILLSTAGTLGWKVYLVQDTTVHEILASLDLIVVWYTFELFYIEHGVPKRPTTSL